MMGLLRGREDPRLITSHIYGVEKQKTIENPQQKFTGRAVIGIMLVFEPS
jgi:hypothetical protein